VNIAERIVQCLQLVAAREITNRIGSQLLPRTPRSTRNAGTIGRHNTDALNQVPDFAHTVVDSSVRDHGCLSSISAEPTKAP
jgi:hypothetical protein